MRERWLPVGAAALVLFAVNIAARFVTEIGDFDTESQQMTIAMIAIGAVSTVLAAASAWWSVRYPVGRVFADLGAATLLAGVLSVLLGPLAAPPHSSPFASGLGIFVGQFLMFALIGLVGIGLGFVVMVAAGKDWRSRGLRNYAATYRAKPGRAVRR